MGAGVSVGVGWRLEVKRRKEGLCGRRKSGCLYEGKS